MHVLRLVDALQVDDGDVGTLRRERPDVRRTDALGRSGDDAHPAGETITHASPHFLEMRFSVSVSISSWLHRRQGAEPA